ncbi:hypothetical protein T10_381 [Trichinella papuae]|uniref:Uncharacterized protein n=1 Tax=Trichinella papuae TaxID=268474 RepID=A0A0V1M6D3_9BILA|nr:hypothetical protein T10_381 [Trichinella papuae]
MFSICLSYLNGLSKPHGVLSNCPLPFPTPPPIFRIGCSLIDYFALNASWRMNYAIPLAIPR